MTTYNPHAMLVLLTAVSIAVPSFAQAPENLLSNGSFEADAQAVPAGWGFYGQADEARRIEYVEPGIEGARGVRIVAFCGCWARPFIATSRSSRGIRPRCSNACGTSAGGTTAPRRPSTTMTRGTGNPGLRHRT